MEWRLKIIPLNQSGFKPDLNRSAYLYNETINYTCNILLVLENTKLCAYVVIFRQYLIIFCSRQVTVLTAHRSEFMCCWLRLQRETFHIFICRLMTDDFPQWGDHENVTLRSSFIEIASELQVSDDRSRLKLAGTGSLTVWTRNKRMLAEEVICPWWDLWLLR